MYAASLFVASPVVETVQNLLGKGAAQTSAHAEQFVLQSFGQIRLGYQALIGGDEGPVQEAGYRGEFSKRQAG